MLQVIGFENTYIERSAMASMPFFFMVVGAGVAYVAEHSRWLAAVTLGVVCSANLVAYYVYDDEWTVYKPNPDWRSTARYFGDELAAGAADRPVFCSTPNALCLSYYDERIAHARELLPSEQEQRLLGSIARKLGRDGFPGRQIYNLVASMVAEFEHHRANRRDQAELLVYSTLDGSRGALRLDERDKDGVFYLVRNHWYPPNDRSVPWILATKGFQVEEHRHFRSIDVYKIRHR